ALAEVAGAPYPGRSQPAGLPVGLEATEYFVPTAATYSNGAHAAVVEVDVATGAVTVLRYAIVHDCGNVINPLVMEGQILGGLVAGLGNALLEEVIYDDGGQLLSGSLLHSLMRTAPDPPAIGLAHLSTPSPPTPPGR